MPGRKEKEIIEHIRRNRKAGALGVGCICDCEKCESKGLHATDECHIEDERRAKGDGRESDAVSSIPGASLAAAANPACPDCEDFRQIVDPVPSQVHWCHERIRELEARVKELEEGLRKAENAGLEMLHRLESDPDEKECLG